MSENTGTIGVVLPAYNEAKVIGGVLDGIPRTLSINAKKYRVIVILVDDGSSDGTSKIAKAKNNAVVIDHIINSGAGAATRTGLHYAKTLGCDFTATMDSDGQHSPKDLKRLVEAAVSSGSDLVIGSRLKSKDGNMPIQKKIGNLGLSLLTYLLLGVYVSDSQSGLKIFNKKALSLIEYHSNDYAFCSEIIWKAHQAKLEISETPIRAIYTDYSLSRGQKNITGAMEIVKQLIKRRFLSIINE